MFSITSFKNTLSIFLFLISLGPLIAQSDFSGNVIDDQGKSVDYVTIAAYSLPDTSFIGSAMSGDHGGFSFELKNPSDTIFLRVSMLGFEDYEAVFTSRINNEIILQSLTHLLDEVEVKARKPLLEQRADKLIVHVADNVTNTGGSIIDIMRKVPGVIVINDRLSLPGGGAPTILIDGRSTKYMDMESLLADMPADNIQKVEIINQPGAEYEASGSNPVINIILKKNSLKGTNGSASFGLGYGQELWDYNSNVNLNYASGKLNVSGGLGYSKNAYNENIKLERRLTKNSGDLNGNYAQENEDQANPISYRGEMRIAYDLDEKHTIGFDSKYITNNNDRIATNFTNVELINFPDQNYSLTSDNSIDSEWKYISFNPYYSFDIDTSGKRLEVDATYGNFITDRSNVLSTNYSYGGQTEFFRNVQPGDTKIYALSADYIHPINTSITLQTGIKGSFADLDNDLQSSNKLGEGEYINNPLQSNHYLFNESIYAAFGKMNWQHKKWSGTLGLRYERSLSEGKSVSIDTSLSRDIRKLFPSGSLTRNFGKLGATMAYSYRIDRPRYSSLNPFVYYLDPFTFQSGNSNLLPELTHSAKFSLTFQNQPFFNVEYRETKDAITEVTIQDAYSEEAQKKDVNFDKTKGFSVSLFFPLDFIPHFSGYGGIIQAHNTFNSVFEGDIFERKKWSTTLFIQANTQLPGEINLEMGGWYNSGQQEGIFDSEYLYGTSIGLSKKLLNKQLKLSLGAEDFLNKFWSAKVDYQQDMDINVRWQAPRYSLKLKYRFGNQYMKNSKKRKSSGSDEINRASVK